MRNRKASSLAAALALTAGILLAPAGTFARGGGHAAPARGPVFGFPRVHIAPHRRIAPEHVQHAPARLGWKLGWLNRHRFAGRNGTDVSAAYPYAAGSGYGASYDPNVTGTIAAPPPDMLLPPRPALEAPEHIGCISRGYEVPSEYGGVARVTVTRC